MQEQPIQYYKYRVPADAREPIQWWHYFAAASKKAAKDFIMCSRTEEDPKKVELSLENVTEQEVLKLQGFQEFKRRSKELCYDGTFLLDSVYADPSVSK